MIEGGIDLSLIEYFVQTEAGGQQMPATIDLFCGAGGITEGFRQAGYKCLYAIDFNPSAIETFRANHLETWAECDSIENVNPQSIRRKLGLQKGELPVLMGGPPCQGFSINAPERFLDDPRNSLFKHYIRFLDEFQPQAFLFENVPGMLSLANGHLFEQVLKEFKKRGYHANAKILFAAHYGVPQERWRLIILGSLFTPGPEHPYPTHYAFGRANFTGGRAMTFQLNSSDEYRLLPKVTVGEAISDLPRLEMGEGAEIISYTCPAAVDYTRRMLNPKGYTFNHYAAKLSKQNAERMKFIKPGGSWRDIPHSLLPAGMQRARTSDHTKRYGRLRSEDLSGTIMTKCDPHWGAVILPDQDRALTVREAARIQSFPDTFRFYGSRVSQYEQVGNAVPVLMARAIAQSLAMHLQAFHLALAFTSPSNLPPPMSTRRRSGRS